MSEMLTRVAAAIGALAKDDFGCGSDRCCCYGPQALECKSGLKVADIARAAIEAMREPTEAMLLNRYGEESGFEGPSVHEAKLTWRFMIDAALKEDAHG